MFKPTFIVVAAILAFQSAVLTAPSASGDSPDLGGRPDYPGGNEHQKTGGGVPGGEIKPPVQQEPTFDQHPSKEDSYGFSHPVHREPHKRGPVVPPKNGPEVPPKKDDSVEPPKQDPVKPHKRGSPVPPKNDPKVPPKKDSAEPPKQDPVGPHKRGPPVPHKTGSVVPPKKDLEGRH